MRVGKEWSIDRIGEVELAGLAADLGVRPRFVRERLEKPIGGSPGAWEAIGALPELEEHSERQPCPASPHARFSTPRN